MMRAECNDTLDFRRKIAESRRFMQDRIFGAESKAIIVKPIDLIGETRPRQRN